MSKMVYVTNAPEIKRNESGELFVKGNFEFIFSSEVVYFGDDLKPVKQIQFGWSVECPYDMDPREGHNMMADKLREDFLKFLSK